MFPFGNSSNGNPILHSSFLSNQILLHQHDLPTHHHFLGVPNGHLIDNDNSFAANNVVINNSNKSKKPVKKDRHSKILTSQGHRDRRVRLSIGVARKFFDLQDMLGYDKPSKTLDWLFTKSKLAIEEVMISDESKKSIGTPSSVNNNSECDEDVIVPVAAVDELTKKAKQERDSRAKARARARERTIKKIWTQIAPNREAVASHYNNCTRNWNDNDVNPTIMRSMAAPTTICCTSLPQVDQKAWNSYHGSQI